MEKTIESVKDDIRDVGWRDFFTHVRNYYLRKQGYPGVSIPSHKEEKLCKITARIARVLDREENKLWEDQRFHLLFRLTRAEDVAELLPSAEYAFVQNTLSQGRNMSVLPFNVVLPSVTKKYIPSLPSLYHKQRPHSLDPYGIFRRKDIIYAVNAEGERIYLGSRKFDYAVLLNITEFCPVGCSGCYKGTITRIESDALNELDPHYAAIKHSLRYEEKRAIQQVSLLSQWLRMHPEVDSIIISGGEPLLYSPEAIRKILFTLGEVPSLRVIRICTSAVFQGLFFLIDDTLINVFKEFSQEFRGTNENPRKQLYFNCHVTDEHQLQSPEAAEAIEKLREAGVIIFLQMPLQEGINFYREDISRTAEKLLAISRAAYRYGAIPYKAIVDMHSPSHPSLTVPIEKVSEAIAVFDEHAETSDMARWQAYNVLHEQGNFYVYPAPHFVYLKEIDEKRGRVVYYVPKKYPHKPWEIHTYEEPLLSRLNDNAISPSVNDPSLLKKLEEVQQAYHKLLEGSVPLDTFYDISGIHRPNNEPLFLSSEKTTKKDAASNHV